MRQLFVLLLLLKLFFTTSAQSSQHVANKPIIDTSTFDNWPQVCNAIISNDGEYISYEIRPSAGKKPSVTILRSRDDKWIQKLNDVSNLRFSNANDRAIFIKEGQGLFIWRLGGVVQNKIPNVSSFQLVKYKRSEWLVCNMSNENKELVIQDLNKDDKIILDSIDNYVFSPSGEAVVTLSHSVDDRYTLTWVGLNDKSRMTIWSSIGNKIGSIIFDRTGNQMAFRVSSSGKQSIWHFRLGMKSGTCILDESLVKLNQKLTIGNLNRFTSDGEKIIFNLERRVFKNTPEHKLANVSIWNYKDLMLSSEQRGNIESNNRRGYLSILNVNNGQFAQLQMDNERISNTTNDQIFLLLHLGVDQDVSAAEVAWNPAYKNPKLYIVSFQDGNRILLPWHDRNFRSTISPNGKYVIYRDDSSRNYFSYEVATGIIRNITEKIKSDFTGYDGYRGRITGSLIPIACWLKEDVGVFIYDRYDVWLIDPGCKYNPINITNGFGKLNSIILRLSMPEEYRKVPLQVGNKIIFAAFNEKNKINGYFSKILGQPGNPEKLIMDSCIFTNLPVYSTFDGNLIKAANANAWVLMKQKSNESPNYFWTTNFKSLYQLSDIKPERNWNWLTTELHSWVSPDGDTLQGVLYKPENFDASKKYPLLITYYRQFSNELYLYHKPQGSGDRINIPWFVSRGYCVFTADIHHRVPDLKESVINSIVSAGNYLSKLVFIDSNRMGVQGHSFGGLETGYLVTNSSIFSAACAASGYYNLISDVGSVLPGHGLPRGGTSESHMGGTLWDRKKDFITNSPIFSIDKVKTPILLMAGKLDGQVRYEQSLEFFIGLRRLRKRAWLLSYEDDGHALSKKNNIFDYTIRMTQYFDHYLKGMPAPKWMIQGIPEVMRSIDSGYELDPFGSCGDDCTFCKMINLNASKGIFNFSDAEFGVPSSFKSDKFINANK